MAKHATLHITGMKGKACRDRVQKALSDMTGVSQAMVNITTETATVEYNQSLASESNLIKVVENAGYGVVTTPYREIPAGEFNSLLGSGDHLVVDLRQEVHFAREHIMGAINIPLITLVEGTDELPWDLRIVFICEDGTDSMVACEILLARGFPPQNLISVADGMIGSRKVGCPMAKGVKSEQA